MLYGLQRKHFSHVFTFSLLNNPEAKLKRALKLYFERFGFSLCLQWDVRCDKMRIWTRWCLSNLFCPSLLWECPLESSNPKVYPQGLGQPVAMEPPQWNSELSRWMRKTSPKGQCTALLLGGWERFGAPPYLWVKTHHSWFRFSHEPLYS